MSQLEPHNTHPQPHTPTDAPRPGRFAWLKDSAGLFVAALFVGMAIVAIARNVTTGAAGVAETPAAFTSVAGSEMMTDIDDALAASAETGKPVFAFITADWCPPCQRMKKTTFTNETVAATLTEHFIPVYLEQTASADSIAKLPFQGFFPTSITIVDGKVAGMVQGFQSPEVFNAFLAEAALMAKVSDMSDMSGDTPSADPARAARKPARDQAERGTETID